MARRMTAFAGLAGLLTSLSPTSVLAVGLPDGVFPLNNEANIYVALTGEAAGDHLGMGVAGGGDLDGDGFPDVAVAAPGAGRVYILFGGARFPDPGSANVGLAAGAVLSLPVASGVDEHYALAFNDLDNDGLDDLIVGSPFYDSTDDNNAGRVWVAYGRESWSDLNLETAGDAGGVLKITSTTSSGQLGFSVAGGRDVGGADADVGDMILGAPGKDAAYLIYGRSSRVSGIKGSQAVTSMVGSGSKGVAITRSGADPLQVGYAVALTPPLLSGESRGSVLVGAPKAKGTANPYIADCGAVYLFYPPLAPGGVTTGGANTTYNSQCTGGDFLRNGSVLAAGLLDDDAYGDLLISSPLADSQEEGRLFIRIGSSGGPDRTLLYTGPAGYPHLSGYGSATSHEQLASSIALADIDGDGNDDIVLGADNSIGLTSQFRSDGGQVYVLLSGDPIVSAGLNGWVGESDKHSAVLLGESAGDGAGWAVAGAGDLFRSTYESFVIGAPYYDFDGVTPEAGRVYVFVPNDTVDHDSDGKSIRQGDCNESSAQVKPGQIEVCDGLDNDCDGTIDEGLVQTLYKDSDGDGFGVDDAETNIQGCVPPSEYAAVAGDCNDESASVNPGATETCNFRDDDCDHQTDENVSTLYYYDNDGDGFGGGSTRECSQPGGTVTQGGDCDDADPLQHPNTVWYIDVDGDGFGNEGFPTIKTCNQPSGYVYTSGDCDDSPTGAGTNPDADEVCDEADNDCDETVDEGVTITFYQDSDGDGYGKTNTTVQECSKPQGYAASGGDCADADAQRFPGNPEVCDGKDNDCVSGIPANESDSDGDGVRVCANDCDDNDAARFPGNPEICDGKDNNCDSTLPVNERDVDSDQYMECSGCAQGLKCGDCDDSSAAAYPGKAEVCDDRDNDCNGASDEDPSFDKDSDGFKTCAQPSQEKAVDCDDVDPDTYPGAPEKCDNKDNDCDTDVSDEQEDDDQDGFPACAAGLTVDCDDTTKLVCPDCAEVCDAQDNDCDELVDDADSDVTGQPTWYRDADSDQARSDTETVTLCVAPQGYISGAAPVDCNDADKQMSPLIDEVCNEKDSDCDGTVDEGVQDTFWLDADGDRYGDLNSSIHACQAPAGYEDNPDDCDDADPQAAPSQPETCDAKDNDCDEGIDEGFDDEDGIGGVDCLDNDGDGYTEGRGDCDDEDASVYPGADETELNDIDNDCDEAIDEDATDIDLDGFTADDGDCNDGQSCDSASADYADCIADAALIYPGAEEVCDDRIDNDCSGLADDGCEDGGFFPGCSTAPSRGGPLGGLLGALLLAAPVVLRRRRAIPGGRTASEARIP